MHVYHFGAYEPVKFKWLMGRYATREDEIDRMLRAEFFVDLHTIFKQAVRAGVEEYSLKTLEPFHNFHRTTPLDAIARRHALYRALARTWCGWRSARRNTLRDGGIQRRRLPLHRLTARLARKPTRPARKKRHRHPQAGSQRRRASEKLDERQKRVAALVAQLTENIPIDPADRSVEQSAQWLLAQLLDWHRREDPKPIRE